MSNATSKGPTDAIKYDYNAPVLVLDKKGNVLWEGQDILDAMKVFRKKEDAHEIRRDGVLLAHASQARTQEAVVRTLSRIALAAYRREQEEELAESNEKKDMN